MTAEIAAHYHVGTDTDVGGVINFDMHPRVLELVSEKAGYIARNQEILELSSDFIAEETRWGFGGVAELHPSELVDGWTRLCFVIPNLVEGQTEDYFIPDQQAVLPITASMALPLRLLNLEIKYPTNDEPHAQIPTDPDRGQLVTVDLGTSPDSYGARISAMVYPAMIRWLRANLSEELESEVSRAMFRTYARLVKRFGRLSMKDELFYYPVALRSSRDIHLDVPGNAAGLDSPSSSYKNETSDEEYHLSPHNVDTIPQQLGLLAGVAYLSQRALASN